MLKKFLRSGYPFEFLIARLNNRIKMLILSVNYLKSNPEYILNFDWNNFNLNFRKELNNCYLLMEEKERVALKNIFLFFEITNILAIIRLSLYNRRYEIEKILQNSLIDEKFFVNLLKEEFFELKLKNFLSNIKRFSDEEIKNLLYLFRDHGFKAFEERFVKLFIESLLMNEKNNKEVIFFLKNLIDFININTIWKEKYWDSSRDKILILGGFLNREDIEKEIKSNKFINSLSYLRTIVNKLSKKKFLSDYYFVCYYISCLYLENLNLNILYNTIGLPETNLDNYLL